MNTPNEDPLERLLDEQSDEEFGEVSFREHLSQDQTPLVLKSWTAKDFSDIYVRFYPHLLRHAKRFLSNHSQAEEVVQDAFLYLMTSLPEIDNEVGVLKLLKWKIRLLAFDVVKINSRASFSPILDDNLLVSDESELDEDLIHADEAAIVSLALAKLPPRQREALIASIYQEKATADVAEQLQLSENATRQLIFRAKTAFKKALIGEAEVQGLAISEILSIAARKARAEAGKYISAASALLLVIAVGLGIMPNINPQTTEQIATPESSSKTDSQAEVPSESSATAPIETAQDTDLVAQAPSELDPKIQEPEPQAQLATVVRKPQPETKETTRQVESPSLGVNVVLAQVVSPNSGFSVSPAGVNGTRELTVFSAQGLSSSLVLSGSVQAGYSLKSPVFFIDINDRLLRVEVGSYGSSTSTQENRSSLTLVATGFSIISPEGIPYAEQPFIEAVATITIELDRLGQPIQANLFLD
jgi:RNA polymerase sigma factor (sigma-70 family)